MGFLAAIGSLPFPLLALPTGATLDRSRRLPMILASDAMLALSLASAPSAWGQVVTGGGADQIFLTFLVGRDKLIDAQSTLGAPAAILCNLAAFTVWLWNLRQIRVREPAPVAP